MKPFALLLRLQACLDGSVQFVFSGGAAHLEQFVLLQSLSGHVQGQVIRVNLATEIHINQSRRRCFSKTNGFSTGLQQKTRTTPLTKFRYLGIMSLKSSVMKTLLTNSCQTQGQNCGVTKHGPGAREHRCIRRCRRYGGQ